MRLFLCSLILPLLAVIALNKAVNAGGLGEHDEVMAISAKQAKDELLSSETVFDQRAWLKARLAGTCPEVLVIGSSTVGAIREELLRGKTLVNGWLGGGLTTEDYEALAGVLEERGCVPKTVIIGADLWSVGAEFNDQRWTVWFDEYLRFHDFDLLHRLTGVRIAWARFTEVLNFTTTLESSRRLYRRLRGRADPSQLPQVIRMSGEDYCQTIDREHTIRSYDGHYTSCPLWEHPQAEVERIAEKYLVDNARGIRNWKTVDTAGIRSLERVVERLSRRGSQVTLFGPPYHPTTFKTLKADPIIGPNIRNVDAILTATFASTPGVKFVNLRDPATSGCGAEEFHDGHHAAPSCVKKVIDTLFERGGL